MNKKVFLLAGILVLSVLAAYSNVYDMQFVYDDEFYFIKNQYLTSFENIGKIFTTSATAGAGFQDSFYRPMQFFLYLVTSQTLGFSEAVFHFLNVFLHTINVLLLFWLSLIIGFRKEWAFAVALIWGMHPLHTEVIAYMSGTADPLQFTFLFLATIAFFKRPKGYWFYSVFFFICGFLSKEVAIVYPGLLFSLLFLTQEKRWSIKTYIPTFIFLAVALVYVSLRSTILDLNGDFHFYKTENIYTQNIQFRIYTFLATLPKYFELMFYPHDLHIDRAFPVYVAFFLAPVLQGFAILVSLICTCTVLLYKKTKIGIFLSAMTIWFFAAHSLHTGILVPMNSFFLEHWLYTPSVAVAWMIIYGLQRIPIKYGMPVAGIVAVALGAATYQQNRVWESPITLFSRILQFNPGASRVRHNLAMAYSDRGDDERAKKEYETVLTDGSKPYPQTYHNLALIYLKKNQLEEGEKLLLKAVEISPQFHPSYDYLIQVYQFKKDQFKVQEWTQKRNALSR